MAKTRRRCSRKNGQLQKASSALSVPLGRVCCGMGFSMFTLLTELGRTCGNGLAGAHGPAASHDHRHNTLCNLTTTVISSPRCVSREMPCGQACNSQTPRLASMQHCAHVLLSMHLLRVKLLPFGWLVKGGDVFSDDEPTCLHPTIVPAPRSHSSFPKNTFPTRFLLSNPVLCIPNLPHHKFP